MTTAIDDISSVWFWVIAHIINTMF